MDPAAIFAAVALAHALAVSSPGPDLAVLVRQTLAHGRRVGVATAMGIGSGVLVHVAWGLFALGWAADRLPAVLDGLRYGGAAALLWIGLRALRSRPQPAGHEPAADGAPRSWVRAYALGLGTNLLNPKAVLFFAALGSAVIAAGAGPTLRFALGLWMALASAAFFAVVAAGIGHPGVRRRLGTQAHRIDRAMGVVLIGLALAVALGF